MELIKFKFYWELNLFPFNLFYGNIITLKEGGNSMNQENLLKGQTIFDVMEFSQNYDDGCFRPLVCEQDTIKEQALHLRDKISVFYKDDSFGNELLEDVKRICKNATGKTIRKSHIMKLSN